MRKLFLLLLLVGGSLVLSAQNLAEERFSLPRKTMPLEKCLIKLNEAGAELSYRPDQIPKIAVKSPGGRRTLRKWLTLLLRDTELLFEDTGNGLIIYPDFDLSKRRFTIYGNVTDQRSGERLIASAIQDIDGNDGVLSNEYGFYTFTLPGGRKRLQFSYVGYAAKTLDVVIKGDTTINVSLLPAGNLPEVIVTPTPDGVEEAYLRETRSSIGPEETAQMGGPGGEADPLRLARLLPGVESGADGLGGIFIRGSESGHNLVLLDGVPVYNLNHAAGLLSIFNNHAIRRVDLYKDGLPARFGGRIGGVLDVHTRDGNLYDFEAKVGTSLLSAHFAAEGPIKRGESSFLVTGRTFWGKELLGRLSEIAKENAGRTGRMDYSVYDLNFKFNQRVGKKGHLYLSLFNGADDYSNNAQTVGNATILTSGGAVFPYESVIDRQESVAWGNTVGALRYNHVFSDHFFGNFRLSYSDLVVDAAYEKSDSLKELFDENDANVDLISGRYGSAIKQLGLAFDGQMNLPASGEFRFGGELNLHRFLPQLRVGNVQLSEHPTLDALEENHIIRPLQLSAYGSYAGKWKGIQYRFGLRGQIWRSGRNYLHLSPRILLAGKLNEQTSWRFAFDQAVQPVHLISSTVIGLPSDLWVPATEAFGPSTSQQTSMQFTRHLSEDWNFVMGVYYRDIRDLVSYTEDGQDWQRNLSSGDGFASGVELTLNKTRGLFSGWLSYTLSESRRDFDEKINRGRAFDFRYGRRHSFKALVRYQPTPKVSLTANFRYGSGAAYSLSSVTLRLADPATVVDPQEIEVDITDRKNGFRLPANHRLDVNARFVLSSPESSMIEHTLSIGIYNLYNRKNPIYYDVESNYESAGENLTNRRRFKQVFIPGLLPMVSYHLKIKSRPIL